MFYKFSEKYLQEKGRLREFRNKIFKYKYGNFYWNGFLIVNEWKLKGKIKLKYIKK